MSLYLEKDITADYIRMQVFAPDLLCGKSKEGKFG